MPVSHQGSRAGLITTLVIFTILFVLSTILAFWSNAQMRNAEKDLVELKKRYAEVITESALTSEEVQGLKSLRTAEGSGFTPSMKVFDIALSQRDQLIKLITGNPATISNTVFDAQRAALTALADASSKAKAAVPSSSDNLAGAVSRLADTITQQQASIQQLEAKVAEADTLAKNTIKQKDTELAARDEQVKQVRAEADKEKADAQADRAAKQNQIAEIEKAREEERKVQQDAQAKKDVDLAAKNDQIKKLDQRLRVAQSRFDKLRIDVTEPIARIADGQIIRRVGKNVVYINRGKGDQISPGLTFEIYDKNEGIPKLTDTVGKDKDLPVGKASIEVVRVNDTNSECRVVRSTLASPITEGDYIVNIVYDPAVKYNFVVYGKFDLDHNGLATVRDTDVVKRLIAQWGAKVMDRVTVDTDFVVMGKEPIVPVFTSEELNDPANAKKKTDAEKELEDYANIILQARDLHIPILNQNRFLCFTGYYDLAKR